MPKLSPSQIAGYAQKSGLSGQAVVVATAIALGESGGNTDATNTNSNGSTDYGVWQINSVHKDLLNTHNWRDPADNAAMMFTLSNGGTNWKPWSVYKSGAYLTHMGTASSVTPDTSVTGGVTQVQTGGQDAFTALQNFAHVISDPRTWVRLGMVIAGGVLIAMAFHISIPLPIPPVAKLAKKAVSLQSSSKEATS